MRSALLCLLLALSACNGSSTEARDPEPAGDDRTATAGHEQRDAPPAKAPDLPASPPATAANYEITTRPQGPFKVGGEGRVDVRLTGRNGYHVNQEYPIELALQPAEGLKLAKAKLVRADASTFEEAQAIFPVALTPESAGRKALRGTLNFSVCNPQNCLLERHDVSVDVEAAP